MATTSNQMTSGGIKTSERIMTSGWVTTSGQVTTSHRHTMVALPYLRPLTEASHLLAESGSPSWVLVLKVRVMALVVCWVMRWWRGNKNIHVTGEGRGVAGEGKGWPPMFHRQGLQEDLLIATAVGKVGASKGWARGHHGLTVPSLCKCWWSMVTTDTPVGPASPPNLEWDGGRAHQLPASSTLCHLFFGFRICNTVERACKGLICRGHCFSFFCLSLSTCTPS